MKIQVLRLQTEIASVWSRTNDYSCYKSIISEANSMRSMTIITICITDYILRYSDTSLEMKVIYSR